MLLLAAAAALLVTWPYAHAQTTDYQAEYQRRFQALNANDLEGHVELAKWCREVQEWGLLRRQAQHVLTLAPDHQLAKLMLELAKSKLGEQGEVAGSPSPGPGTPGSPMDRTGKARKPKPLTDEQIQRLRRAELRPVDRHPVKFNNDVVERFWNYFSQRQAVPPAARANFMKLKPFEKAFFIIQAVKEWQSLATDEQPFNDIFTQDILIERDPILFREFATNVERHILAGCASAKCHGGEDARGFRLFNERIMSDGMHYANYLQLHNYEYRGERLINRDFPERSLLLVFGQPVAGNTMTLHPGEIDVVYRRGREDPKYLAIGRWISALGVPAPEYSVELEYEDAP
jgi:hypothetical protein